MKPPTQLLPRDQQGAGAPGGPPKSGFSRLLSSRRGTIAVAVVAGVAALSVLLVFMANYRDSVRSGAEPIPVLVADRQLDSGTSGDAIAEAGLFRTMEIREDEAAEGAFTDVDSLRGKRTTVTIYEGQQLAAGDFGTGTDAIAGRLEGIQRALSVPVDSARGNIGQVRDGSRVDVLGGFDAEQSGGRARPVLDILARDVLVLKAPENAKSGTAGGENQAIVLRLSDREATRVAFAADRGQVWLTIRPPTLAKDSSVNTVDVGNLLAPGSGR